jgi:ubiquitin carboxyl-terminal hydrolase 4/11/15
LCNKSFESDDDKQYDELELPDDILGKSGFSNIGNTCYMNASLQCLLSNTKLIEYFISNKFKNDLNK